MKVKDRIKEKERLLRLFLEKAKKRKKAR